MFEHLDDPRPFVADERLRAAVVADGGRRRRQRRRRLVAGGGAVAVVVLAVAGWAYVDGRDDAIDRVEVSTQPSTDGAVNVLLLGDDAGEAGTGEGRVDAAVLVRVDESGVHLVSIPRDLADPTSGERFNELARGDLQSGVDAVHAVVGDVPIDHVVRLGFDGFVALVDAVGGIPVRIEAPIVDEPTGTRLETGDCVTLDGMQALGLVRARHVAGDPSSDLGRMERQRVLLQAALAATDATDVDALSRVVADHAVVDDDLDLATMVALGRRLAGAGAIEGTVLPLAPATRADGAAVLELAEGADAVLARFGATGSPAEAAPGRPVVEPSVPGGGIAPC